MVADQGKFYWRISGPSEVIASDSPIMPLINQSVDMMDVVNLKTASAKALSALPGAGFWGRLGFAPLRQKGRGQYFFQDLVSEGSAKRFRMWYEQG